MGKSLGLKALWFFHNMTTKEELFIAAKTNDNLQASMKSNYKWIKVYSVRNSQKYLSYLKSCTVNYISYLSLLN